ncbi:AMX protein, partial [Acromyrmex heyeri]
MNVVRINSKNVIFLFMALLSTSVQEARMDYGTATSYALKEANVNSTPAYSSKKVRFFNPLLEQTNCTVNNDILCLGRRKFMKNLPCNWTVGYRWSTALILSITLGGFGADRFYLGHWQEGIGKLFSFGGLGVWTLIDVILISMRYLGPADGSLYI